MNALSIRNPQDMIAQLLEAIMSKTPPLWLTLQQASDFMGLSKYFLVRMAKAGRINASKAGGKWMFQRRSLERVNSLDLQDVEEKLNRVTEAIRHRHGALDSLETEALPSHLEVSA
jgi:excisionase family DNA binding protein